MKVAIAVLGLFAGLSLDRLSTNFDLTGSALLKGFYRSSRGFSDTFEKGPQEIFKRRFFHGPSDVRYSVLVFESAEALSKWNRNLNHGAMWFGGAVRPGSELKAPMQMMGSHPKLTGNEYALAKKHTRNYMVEHGLRPDNKTIEILLEPRIQMWQTIAFVDRIAIVVTGEQHETMVRRGQADARLFLSDKRLSDLVKSIAIELVKRAKNFRE